VIDETGRFVVEPQFTSNGIRYQGGVISVQKDGLQGYIDKNGQWVTQIPGEYLPRHKIVRTWDSGYFLDTDGNLFDHYANHMLSGYQYLKTGQYSKAAEAFQAALRINPGDEAALYGIEKAK